MRNNGHPEPGKRPTSATTLLISAEDLATILGTSKRTVWRLLSAGIIPQPVRLGKSTRWRLDDIHRWIDTGCPQPKKLAQPGL